MKINLNIAFAGILVTSVGVLLFLDKLGVIFPLWLLTWPMLLVLVGVYKMVKHQLRHGSGVILTIIGLVFLAPQFYPNFSVVTFIWPIVLMLLGLSMLFRSQQTNHTWFNKKCAKFACKKAKMNMYEN